MAGVRTIANTLTMVKSGAEAEDTVVGGIASIGAIKTETDEIDVTTLDSPNMAKEFIQGASDSGDFDVEINNVFDGTVTKLDGVFSAGETRAWTITFTANDGTTEEATLDFNAFIKGFEHGEQTTDGLAKVTMTLRVSGKPVYAESA